MVASAARLAVEVAALCASLPAARDGPVLQDHPAAELPRLVTLDQAAATVHRSKRTLERYKGHGLPAPRVRGHRGQPHLYDWSEIRPWLAGEFGVLLPERFPNRMG